MERYKCYAKTEYAGRIAPAITIGNECKRYAQAEYNGRVAPAATIGTECAVLPAKRGVAQHSDFAKQNMCEAAERSGINSIL